MDENRVKAVETLAEAMHAANGQSVVRNKETYRDLARQELALAAVDHRRFSAECQMAGCEGRPSVRYIRGAWRCAECERTAEPVVSGRPIQELHVVLLVKADGDESIAELGEYEDKVEGVFADPEGDAVEMFAAQVAAEVALPPGNCEWCRLLTPPKRCSYHSQNPLPQVCVAVFRRSSSP